jgi:hypothetical protein
LGEPIPLNFHWYHKSNPIGEKFVINLDHGDMYIMSQKAIGQDWKKSSMLTLRHSAGNVKQAEFTGPKKVNKKG